ncbi:MAG: sulfite exporter TauE/SafE family protein [Acidobacteriota bacterium]
MFVAIGFLAQLVDGALGMAYGVISNTLLLSLGLSPAVASASVHAAEIVTTGVSGLSHHAFGNVDRFLLKRLAIPGVIGAALGAYALVSAPGDSIKPFVALYLLLMGLLILWKTWTVARPHRKVTTHLRWLGLMGGFCDASGGGGWGPIVASTLVARGHHPRTSIGSVNLAEFFVTVSASVVFILTVGLSHWSIVVALIIGGVAAAPLAAYAAKLLPTRPLMFLVGMLIVLTSLRTILLAWF